MIPVPAIEIKRAFIQNLTDTIRIFFKGTRGSDGAQRSRFFEKSVVQPRFQEKGRHRHRYHLGGCTQPDDHPLCGRV